MARSDRHRLEQVGEFIRVRLLSHLVDDHDGFGDSVREYERMTPLEHDADAGSEVRRLACGRGEPLRRGVRLPSRKLCRTELAQHRTALGGTRGLR